MIETVFSLRSNPQWPGELDHLVRQPRREPFDAEALSFVSALSSRILLSPLARHYPELATLADWFRPANLKSMRDKYLRASGQWQLCPRGLVFLLAPANVDVLFIYGWLLSLIAGNASIVRVSQKSSAMRDAFVALLGEFVADVAFATALADSWLITYDHDDAITTRISSVCDARLIWGGDATVAHVRSVALKPVAVEVAFPDRFSFAIFSADRIYREPEPALREIARRFVNDTLWFAQQACSSPRAVFWIGEATLAESARERFWPVYRAAAAAFENEPSAVMSRVTDLFMLAGVGAIDRLCDPVAAFPGRASGRGSLAEVREIHSGHGMFIEYTVSSLHELPPLIVDKDQTLVAHGFREDEIVALLRSLPGRAVDRIVPPGQGNHFSRVWDGSDLFDVLTRKISLAPQRLTTE